MKCTNCLCGEVLGFVRSRGQILNVVRRKMYSKSSLDHVIPFDGTNLPLWKLGLDVALEENDVCSLVDGTYSMPPEVHIFFSFK